MLHGRQKQRYFRHVVDATLDRGRGSMKVAYPASDQLSQLNGTQRALKIARHSPCVICDGSCPALHPPHDVDVVLDQQFTNESSLGDLGQYGSDADDDDSDLPYLQMCACGHDVRDHNADEFELEPAEFARRTRVAIRLDELLHVGIMFTI